MINKEKLSLNDFKNNVKIVLLNDIEGAVNTIKDKYGVEPDGKSVGVYLLRKFSNVSVLNLQYENFIQESVGFDLAVSCIDIDFRYQNRPAKYVATQLYEFLIQEYVDKINLKYPYESLAYELDVIVNSHEYDIGDFD